MNLSTIEPLKIFECISGSHAYGTSTPESDVDIRGIFKVPVIQRLSLIEYPDQVSDNKQDITFWELNRFFELASGCNPNIIEILWTPDDCIRLMTPTMEKLRQHRNLFMSKKAFHTFGGYAYSQVKRAKGQNKWVNNEKPETRPSKYDFCWFIDLVIYVDDYYCDNWKWLLSKDKFPVRPVKMNNPDFFATHRVAKLEHSENMYRVYSGGEGIFRGPSQQLVCDSISKEDEWRDFCGLLIFNEQEYDRELTDWKNYWDWKKNRNEARYRSMEAGEIDYDAKNMMHCMRLLWSGINILQNSEPIVRFTGDKLKTLMDIRTGKFSYEDLLSMVEIEMAILNDSVANSNISHSVNMNAIDQLYLDLINMQ